MNYWIEMEAKAAAALDEMLAKPSIPANGDPYSDGECFDPWDLFPCLYGSYSGAFDELALEVLRDLRDGTRNRTDLAAEMFREILCTSDLCDYGTSPRVCFPTQALKERLPRLIERWEEYEKLHWGDR